MIKYLPTILTRTTSIGVEAIALPILAIKLDLKYIITCICEYTYVYIQ